jgi:C1A family cysteine protease
MTDFFMAIIVGLFLSTLFFGVKYELASNEIVELKTQLENCNTKIETQDAAVLSQNTVEKNVQSAIVKTEQSNTILSNAVTAEKKTINATPTISDCMKAMNWSAAQAKEIATQFQSAMPQASDSTH